MHHSIPQPPTLLLVEDSSLDAQLFQMMLSTRGFQVTHAASVLEAETCALSMLALESTTPPLILLDIRMPDTSHPELRSLLLVAALCGRMQRSEIQPAHMIALTSHISDEIEEEALFAGCSYVLRKPLTNHHSDWLRDMVSQPVILLPADQGRRLYQQKAEEILQLVRRATVPNSWIEADAHLILSAVTHYPAPKILDEARQAALVLKLGGAQRIRALLKQCAAELPEPHSIILQAYIEGKQQRNLAIMFLDYDRTTIYRYSQALPKRLCDYFITL